MTTAALPRRTLAIAVGSLLALPAAAQPGGGFAPEEIELDERRSVRAETKAAAYNDPDWEPPRTSWGDPSLEGVWSTDDMRSVPMSRPEEFGDSETMNEEQFLQRARRDQAGRDRAVNEETFLRNEYGVRTFGYTSLVVDPEDGQMPDMTDAGRERAGNRDRGTFGPGPFDGFDDFTLYDRCITRGVLGSTLPVIYGNGMRINQSPNEVAISYEMIHDTRVIPLDPDRPHISDEIDQYMGNSRGYFEGDTLVVETSNFTDKTSIGTNGNGTRHSDQLTMTERFTRVDPEMIEYTASVNDPVAYEEPFTIRMMITTQPDYEVYEYSCHEGNGAVGHALSGERAYEKQVAEAIANDEPVPPRANGMSIYAAPEEGAEIIDINEANER